MDLAPIGLSTYIRINHLKRTLEALQANRLASRSDLYIFSDGPRPGDEDKVGEVRRYLKSIGGFKSVTVVERDANCGLDSNTTGGMRHIFEASDRLIWLEEDCVTAPGFLEFMNRALEVYLHNPRIFSVCGYSPPIRIPPDYAHNAYLLPRFCAWGFGIWKDRFEKVPPKLGEDDVQPLLRSMERQSELDLGGLDILNLVRNESRRTHALDARIMFRQNQLGMDTVYPVGSQVLNIGFDGSGLNSVKSTHKDVDLATDRDWQQLPSGITRDPRIIRAHFIWRLGGRHWYRRPRVFMRLVPFLAYRLFHRN